FNYMLTDLQPEDRLMSTGLPVRFRARVELWGKPPEGSAASVTFVVDGAKKDVREVRVSDGSASLVFEHRFAKAGEHLVEAVLEGDEHRVDNRRMYLCSVPESVPVLILDESAPDESGGAAGPAPEAADRTGSRLADRLDFQSAYLARAIAPTTHPAGERVSRFSAKAIPVSRIDYENLDSYSAVALMDCGNLSEAAAAKLEGYVADGGTLWIFLGPRVNAYQYNRFLWREGRGLLPCRIKDGASVASPDPKDAPLIKFGESTHPALTELAGMGSPDARVLRYMNLETEGGGRTVATLSNGTPAILEKDVGRGKVILVNTTAGVEWTMLPATMEFAIMVQDMLRYSIGNPDASVNLNVGDVFEEPVFVTAQHLLLRCPDGRKERLTPRKREDRAAAWTVAFAGTRQQGVYEFMDVSREVLPRLRFVVNQKPEEGDLSRLSRGDFAQAFGSGAWRWIGPETPVEEFVAKLHSVTELAPGVLAALLAVLAVESYLAARFGRRRGGTTT
ncbi:MAG: hypothetical protein N3A38_05720, partial [Planctomycetota bacterium]|nr:hypothetical protein [Planctomycetota bacterium]